MSRPQQLLDEYRRLSAEANELREELRAGWLAASIQDVRRIDARLGEIERRLATIRGLKSVVGQITGS